METVLTTTHITNLLNKSKTHALELDARNKMLTNEHMNIAAGFEIIQTKMNELAALDLPTELKEKKTSNYQEDLSKLKSQEEKLVADINKLRTELRAELAKVELYTELLTEMSAAV